MTSLRDLCPRRRFDSVGGHLMGLTTTSISDLLRDTMVPKINRSTLLWSHAASDPGQRRPRSILDSSFQKPTLRHNT